MEIRTGLLPDCVYPIEPGAAQIVARLDGRPIGAAMRYGAGCAVYLGFRPRDDQSRSMGADVHTLFDILRALGAYAPNSLEARSRPESAKYVMNRFPNGAVSVANHYRAFEERWYGSFFRDEERDRELLKGRALPLIDIKLDNEEIMGRRVCYSGTDALTYRVCEQSGKLIAFAGDNTRGITIDGTEYALFDKDASVAFALMDEKYLADGIKRLILLKADRAGVFTLDLPDGFDEVTCEACQIDYLRTSFAAPYSLDNGRVAVKIGEREKGLWIAVYSKGGRV